MSQRFFRYSSEGKIIKICQTQTKRTSSCHRKKYILVPRCILSLAFSLTPTQIINLKPDISNVSYRRTVEDWTQYFSGAVCRGHEASYYLVSFLPFFFFCFWHRGFFFPFFFFCLSPGKNIIYCFGAIVRLTPSIHICVRGSIQRCRGRPILFL